MVVLPEPLSGPLEVFSARIEAANKAARLSSFALSLSKTSGVKYFFTKCVSKCPDLKASCSITYLQNGRVVSTPEITYSSQLKRTIETAEIALKQTNFPQPVFPLDIFNEIDYGVDENQTEDKVIARIGEQAIKDWDAHATVPEGWKFNPDECIENWKGFAAHIISDEQDVILVVTSNGIARFAPHLTDDFDGFADNHKIKLSTGALGILEFTDNKWVIKDWNVKP